MDSFPDIKCSTRCFFEGTEDRSTDTPDLIKD